MRATHIHLVRKRTLNHFAKLAKWLTCVVTTYLYTIHLNFRYRACFEEGILWHSGNYRVHIHSEMCTWHDSNIQGLHFLGAIKIVATMIHYCYCLMAYGKWRQIIWKDDKYNILLFCVNMFKANADSFYCENVCPDGDIYWSFCIWKNFFWKKGTLMLTFNFDFQNCQKFMP